MFWKKRKDEQNTPLNSAEIGEDLTKAFAAILTLGGHPIRVK